MQELNHKVLNIKIVFGTLEELLRVDFGPPLHCLAICGDLHVLEQEVSFFCEIAQLFLS
jgi:diphthamide biosynthesis methyltransferase